MAERVVDRLEGVEIDEQQREAAAATLATSDRLFEPVFQHEAIAQSGERIAKGRVPELLVGDLQRPRQLRGLALHAGVERRGEHGHGHQGHRDQQHQHAEAVSPQPADAQAERVDREICRGHAGVVHAADRDAHQRRCAELPGDATQPVKSRNQKKISNATADAPAAMSADSTTSPGFQTMAGVITMASMPM